MSVYHRVEKKFDIYVLLFVIACMVVLDTLGLVLPLMVVVVDLFKVEYDKIKDGQKNQEI